MEVKKRTKRTKRTLWEKEKEKEKITKRNAIESRYFLDSNEVMIFFGRRGFN